jgi:hypothetical protein
MLMLEELGAGNPHAEVCGGRVIVMSPFYPELA